MSSSLFSFVHSELAWLSPFPLISAYHLFVAFAPCGIVLHQVIVVLDHLLMLFTVFVVSLPPMVARFGADVIVTFGLAPRIAVPEQQFPPTGTTVLVPRGRSNP